MKNDTKVYVPNGKNNLPINENTYDKTITAKRQKSTIQKDKSVHGKQCNICLRKTLLYVHSTSRNFEKRTGRKPYIYKKESYVVCHECIDIIRKIREQTEITNSLHNGEKYVPTNSDITNYKKERQYMKNMAFLPKPYKIESKRYQKYRALSEAYKKWARGTHE